MRAVIMQGDQRQDHHHGAEVTASGVRYRWWSPDSRNATILVKGVLDQVERRIPLQAEDAGWFYGFDPLGRAGDVYEILADGKKKLPDVASRFQPSGVRGPSQVIDPAGFQWRVKNWKRPALKDLVIYEMHVGTFTPAGTFAGAVQRLQHIRQLGANAVQLMPISAFPGNRNWGYDVVLHFAPAHTYGTPDDLRRFVDTAHEHGLAVIIDVVYNHVCGEPNLLQATSSKYFHTEHGNAWGSSLNFDGADATGARKFFVQNAVYWFDEFHVDGLRLDATHAIVDKSPVHVLREITDAVHQRGGFVIAEDDRNDANLIRPAVEGGLGLDGVWADDFHHVVKMALKPEPIGHFKSYQGNVAELRDTLENGWLFRGQIFSHWKKTRGTDCVDRSPEQFVYCITNHDQAGNRPIGERLNHLMSPEAYRAASMLLLLSPYTPMLFMGQEWGAGTPFVFFTNHEGDFGAMVSKGRLNEFQNFGSLWPDEMLAAMPDPEKPEAFLQSKLNWSEPSSPAHAQIFSLYQECLRLRADDPVLQQRERKFWNVSVEGDALILRYGSNDGPARLVVAHLGGNAHPVEIAIGSGWKKVFSSNEPRFGGSPKIAGHHDADKLRFIGPETILLKKDL